MSSSSANTSHTNEPQFIGPIFDVEGQCRRIEDEVDHIAQSIESSPAGDLPSHAFQLLTLFYAVERITKDEEEASLQAGFSCPGVSLGAAQEAVKRAHSCVNRAYTQAQHRLLQQGQSPPRPFSPRTMAACEEGLDWDSCRELNQRMLQPLPSFSRQQPLALSQSSSSASSAHVTGADPFISSSRVILLPAGAIGQAWLSESLDWSTLFRPDAPAGTAHCAYEAAAHVLQVDPWRLRRSYANNLLDNSLRSLIDRRDEEAVKACHYRCFGGYNVLPSCLDIESLPPQLRLEIDDMPYMAQSLQGVVCVYRLRCLLQSRSYIPVHLAPDARIHGPIALLYDDETGQWWQAKLRPNARLPPPAMEVWKHAQGRHMASSTHTRIHQEYKFWAFEESEAPCGCVEGAEMARQHRV